MTDKRQWSIDKTINVPMILTITCMVAGFGSWMMLQDRRITINEQNSKLQETISKGLQDQITSSEVLNNRDRLEMRDDIKEVKANVNELVKRRR